MNDADIIEGFNNWLDDYEKDPEKFEQTWTTVKRHMKEKADGDSPSYGLVCLGVLQSYSGKEAVNVSEGRSEQSDDGESVANEG